MAKVAELNEMEFRGWLADRPEVIRAMATSHPPDRLYRMKSTGQRVTIVAYAEDRTVRVLVGGEYNFVVMSREVFGVEIDDLEECDLPQPDEPRGDLCEMIKVDSTEILDVTFGLTQKRQTPPPG